MMPGGERDAYARIEPMVTKMAAQVEGTPCATYIGLGGAGHYVKMVHNGIEYADMQLITEAYDLFKTVYGLEASCDRRHLRRLEDERARQLPRRHHGRRSEEARRQDRRGTGRQHRRRSRAEGHRALDRRQCAGTRRTPDRHHRSRLRPCPIGTAQTARGGPDDPAPYPAPGLEAGQTEIDAIRDALYASKIVAYAQGFEQMTAAAKDYGWDLKLGEVATIWRGGCIIRARFLDRIVDAYKTEEVIPNLILQAYFRDAGTEGRAGLAPGRGAGRRTWGRDPGLLVLAELLRRAAAGPRPREPAARPARLLRRPYLSASRPGGLVPHPLGPGRFGDEGLTG